MKYRLSLSGEIPSSALLSNFEGVGLIRGEYLHRAFGSYVNSASGLERIEHYLSELCLRAKPNDVWYRTVDFWSDEANSLRGVDKVFIESNPVIGIRGVKRAIQLPTAFRDELEAVFRVAKEHNNLHVLFPFVSTVDELQYVVGELSRIKWPNRIGVMIEIPSALYCIEDFCNLGASNLLLGLNDLTSLFFGTERRSALHSSTHPLMKKIIRELKNKVPGGVDFGIAGNMAAEDLEILGLMGADYLSLHYFQLPSLLGIPKSELPDANFVPYTKIKTRSLAKQFQMEMLLNELGIQIPWKY